MPVWIGCVPRIHARGCAVSNSALGNVRLAAQTSDPASKRFIDSDLVRISTDAVFHRDVLRPPATIQDDASSPKSSSARPQLPLDLDDL